VSHRFGTFIALIFVAFLVAGCALPTSVARQKDSQNSSWHGRLAVRVAANPADARSEAQALTAEFELEGVPEQGKLTLFTPLGSTAARIDWNRHEAVLFAQGKQQSYTNIATLLDELIGTELPVNAFFSWLKGQPEQAAGWQIDLTQFASGKITARRDFPEPQTEIRVMLEP
jgi:outer membrane lipoprotein LolB